MSAILHTSTHFACAVADGADWREVGRKILEALEGIRTEGDGMSIGFFYATEELAPDYSSLLSLLKNITRIKDWFGATGAGVCGNGISLSGRPAAVILIGKMPEGSFHSFTLPADFAGITQAPLRKWMQNHKTSIALTHGLLCAPAARALDMLREKEGLYTVGGFSSGRAGGTHVAAAHIVADHPVSGVIIDDHLQMMVASSQGCVPAGPVWQVTSCRDNIISEIDGRPALEVLHDSIDQIKLDPTGENPPARRGHIHAAFPVSGVDTGAVMVRNITLANEKDNTLTIAHNVTRGDAIQFIYRDRFTAMDDLTNTLKGLHDRARHSVGEANLKPKALFYFGCAARMPETDKDDEASLTKSIFGDIPMAGFYTAAEVCNGHVYGYTGVAVLIL
ncbi:MAG TPA: FIST N-terminal domain-containing protein [Alphaproteobacteria bacterium]